MKTLFAAVAALIGTAAQAQVAVVAPHPINVPTGQAEAITAVCTNAYRQASGQAVTSDAQTASEVVELNLIGLDGAKGHSVLVNAVRKTAQGQVVFDATLEAQTLTDAPMVCERLSTALVTKTAIEKTQTPTTVTESESTRRARRLSSGRSLGVRTGFIVPLAADATLASMGSLAFDGRFDAGRMFFEVGAGFLVPASLGNNAGYGGLTADLGANYLLTETDFAPYIGGGVQPRLVFSGSGFNLVPYLQVGAMLSRKAGVHFSADARVGQNVLPTITRFSSQTGTQVAGVYPTELSVNLTMGF